MKNTGKRTQNRVAGAEKDPEALREFRHNEACALTGGRYLSQSLCVLEVNERVPRESNYFRFQFVAGSATEWCRESPPTPQTSPKTATKKVAKQRMMPDFRLHKAPYMGNADENDSKRGSFRLHGVAGFSSF